MAINKIVSNKKTNCYPTSSKNYKITRHARKRFKFSISIPCTLDFNQTDHRTVIGTYNIESLYQNGAKKTFIETTLKSEL